MVTMIGAYLMHQSIESPGGGGGGGGEMRG